MLVDYKILIVAKKSKEKKKLQFLHAFFQKGLKVSEQGVRNENTRLLAKNAFLRESLKTMVLNRKVCGALFFNYAASYLKYFTCFNFFLDENLLKITMFEKNFCIQQK